MLNLYKLEIFTAVVETGSFSKAAERLLLTQSAISQHISDLERSLGTRLFERGPRGVSLTKTGEALQGYTIQILRLVAEAQNVVTDVSNLKDGQINIGATPGINVYLLPLWLNDFRNKFTNLSISAQTGTTGKMISALSNRQLDIAIIEGEIESYEQDNLGSLILQEISLYIVVGQGHPFWDVPAIEAGELNKQLFIARPPASQTRIWTDAMLKQLNIQPQIVAEFDNLEAIKQSVSNGMGITLLPDYALQSELNMGLLRAVSIRDVTLVRQVKLIWDMQRAFTPVTFAFLRHLVSRFPQIKSLLNSP